MLLFEDTIGKEILIIVIQDRDALLEDDGAAIKTVIHEVHRAPRHFHAMEHGLPLGMEAGETREEGRVDVHHLPGKRPHNSAPEDAHIAGKDVEIERIGERVSVPAPSLYNTVYFEGIGDCVRSLKGEVPVLPFVTTGATDLRYFRDLGIPSYGFFPITLTKEENLKMHAKDERISLRNIREGLEGCKGIIDFLASDRIP